MGTRISVSSWTLHPELGAPPFWGVGEAPLGAPSRGLPLMQLPQRIADAGIGTMELTHFHLPTLDGEYLDRLREAMRVAGVELWSFLVDAGDITGVEAERDEEWISAMLPVAERLGAQCVRVIAGRAVPTAERVAHSRIALGRLAEQACGRGLRLLTENWFDLLSTPEAVHAVLGGLDVGLNLDFGNWSGDDKYAALARIAPLAEGSHAKAHFENGVLDAADFERCLQLLRDVDFQGPFTLVCDDTADRWEAVAQVQRIAEHYL